jgi:amidohydrolase
MQDKIHEKIKLTATKIAESAGATAEVFISKDSPPTFNDAKLMTMMVPSLEHAAGTQNTKQIAPVTMSEDYSFFQQKIPGLFFFLGAYPTDMTLNKAPVHHTADFMIDERALVTGVKAMVNLTMDYMYLKK